MRRVGNGGSTSNGEQTLFEVATEVMAATKAYYNSEPDILAIEKVFNEHVFELYSHWYQEWGSADAGILTRPKFLNQPPFTTNMRQFLVSARSDVRLFGLVVFWTVDDIDAYLRAYMNAKSNHERDQLGLPMGLAAPFEYTLRCVVPRDAVSYRSGRLVAEPVNAPDRQHGSRGKITYHVFNVAAEFTPLDRDLMEATKQRLRHYQIDMSRTGGSQSTEEFPIMVPKSAFYALQQEAEDLAAAKRALKSANWQRAYPRALLSSRLPNPDEKKIRDDDVYSRNALREAALGMHQTEKMYNLYQARAILEQSKRAMGLRTEDGPTIRELSRLANKEGDILEDAFIFDEETTLLHYKEPDTLIDTDRAEERYREKLRLAMSIDSDALMKGWQWQRDQKKQKLQANPELGDAGETDRVQVEQNMIQAIYGHVFFVAFGAYDIKLLSETIDFFSALKTAAQDALAQLEGGGSSGNSAQQLARALTAEGEGEETRTRASAARKEKLVAAVRHFKVTRKQIKILLLRVQGSYATSMARLVFERRQEGLLASKTNNLVQLAKDGLLARETLEAHLQEVYNDPRIKVPELLPEEKGTVGLRTAGKKKTKKRKATSSDKGPAKKKAKKTET